MTFQQQSDEELLAHLETTGPILPVELIDVCLARQESLTAPFLTILEASRLDDWQLASDARWFRGGHAGKFLLAYQEAAALPIFEQIYASAAAQDEALITWFGTDLAHFAETAVVPLIRILQTETEGIYHYGRAIAATTLKIIALQVPATRAAVLAALRGQLPASPTAVSAEIVADEMWTNIIVELADLQDKESQATIQALYAADLVETEMLPLAEYQAAFGAAFALPPEVDETFDIYAFYDELRQQENQRMNMSGRRNLLRRQGYIPPEPDPQPYANRFSRWFNERLIKGSAKE